MAISYTSNNITFNDVKQVPLTWSGVMGRGENGNFEYAEEDGVEPFINAVEIDWNNAQLGNKVDSSTLTPGEEIIIQTTGQLLSYMSTIAQTTEN